MRFVLDASVAVAAARPQEPSHLESRALVTRVLLRQHQIVVPAIFVVEVSAALARRGEPEAAVRSYVQSLTAAAESIASITPSRAARIAELATSTRLRGADAIYVWLASNEVLDICSLDIEIGAKASAYCRVFAP